MTTLSYACLDSGLPVNGSSWAGFDTRPFSFTHSLHLSNLFGLDALTSLGERMAGKAGRWYIEQGDTTPQRGWSGSGGDRPLPDVIQNVGRDKYLVILKRVQEDAAYRPVVESVQAELSDLSGIDIARCYRDPVLTILITSPGRVTPYHIDGEANLLMQMNGSKTVSIFDGNDREVLPSQELEGFWAGDVRAVQYKPRLEERAWKFQLTPGQGVSNPVIFPHWVQNGPEVSVSLSVNFKRAVDDRADAYKMNHRLRSLGLHPQEPGKLHLVDHLKGLAYRAAKRVKRP